ncbi:PaaI family thioesterase [Demequina iriomotensis]|uniref:PaaI family thioesterase n=1 Tax=Demequina iriomotensis TaxID=1536641 RepID=UPI000780AD59|nr:hotdog fold thioesterase [Demequina iriomotensis]
MSDVEVPVPHVPTDGLIARMGISIVKVTPDIAVGTMPVHGNTQPYGLLHGGASAVLAETLGSLAAMAHVLTLDPDGVAVGVDLNITHVKGTRDGHVTGTATAIHLGRSVASYRIVIADQKGQNLAEARLTCALRVAPAT